MQKDTEADETKQVNGYSRLSCFQALTQADGTEKLSKDDETMSDSNLSLVKTEDSLCPLTRTGSFTEYKGRELDFETWSQCSFEPCE